MSAAPDLIEPIEGYRSWIVRIHPSGDPLLASPLRRSAWAAGAPATAVCDRRVAPGSTHVVPASECDCGIYAYRTPTPALADAAKARGLRAVTGSVALWGDVVRHEEGWRALHAYPRTLTVHAATTDELSYVFTWHAGELRAVPVEQLAEALARAYGIPVEISPGLDPVGPLRRHVPAARRLAAIELGRPYGRPADDTRHGLSERLWRWLAVVER